MTTVVETSERITITGPAAENIRSLMAGKKLNGHFLRVYVAGIGCSGPQYGLAFDENQKDNDVLVDANGLEVLIDPNSLVYLEGATIDYVQTPQGAGFKISNPNPLAMSACSSCSSGCG